jgi:hypothetical protein
MKLALKLARKRLFKGLLARNVSAAFYSARDRQLPRLSGELISVTSVPTVRDPEEAVLRWVNL